MVANTARANGFSVVDLFDFYKYYPASELKVDPIHPNPMGHRIAAHAILEGLEQKNIFGAQGTLQKNLIVSQPLEDRLEL